jgi:endogenous inhibitor of DNA gyrase (YacG/DUF329 family)
MIIEHGVLMKTGRRSAMAERQCPVCGKAIPRSLGFFAVYCSRRCAKKDGAV